MSRSRSESDREEEPWQEETSVRAEDSGNLKKKIPIKLFVGQIPKIW